MDGIGDVCDTGRDRDNDGVQDGQDNCERISNSDQLNTDGDAQGNSIQQYLLYHLLHCQHQCCMWLLHAASFAHFR